MSAVDPAADRDAVIARLSVSRETVERLDTFVALLRQWTPKINLISRNSVAALWSRHIADSAQLMTLCPGAAHHWVDLGTGGGFPGLVVAILATEQRPALRFTLVESDTRKAAFLGHVSQKLALTATVLPQRAEQSSPLSADVVSARALAPIVSLMPMIARHCRPDGVALLLKGARAAAELTVARERWHMDATCVASQTDATGVVVIAKGIRRAGCN